MQPAVNSDGADAKASQFLRYARPYAGSLAALVILNVLSSGVLLAVPLLGGKLLGGMFAGTADPMRMAPPLALCVIAIAVLNFASVSRSAKTAARLLGDVRHDVFRHLQRLPLAFHDEHRRGDVLALMTYEIPRLCQHAATTLVAIPSRLLVAVGSVVMMYRIEPRLALVVPIVLPAFYICLRLVGRHLRRAGQRSQEAEAAVTGEVEQALELLPATKVFTQERTQSARFRSAVDRAADAFADEGRSLALLEPLLGSVAAFIALAILALAGRSYGAGGMSAAALFSFLLYAALLSRPVATLALLYGQVQVARGTLARLAAILGEPTEGGEGDGSSALRARGEIRFEDVSFAYPGRNSTLEGVSFTIAAGETVALAGPNGAGKTTLASLLLRFYAPQAGRILLDGRSIHEMPIDDLRRQIGLVPQLPLLFHGTIRDNIAFGADNPGPEAIAEAARLAQAAEFIAALPLGMDTVIGDRGVRLSGGQRQRIALARALIKHPPILILDEATSMFDDEGETAFIAACARVFKGRTVILIAHRPATLALADRILKVDYGQVSDSRGAKPRATGSSGG